MPRKKIEHGISTLAGAPRPARSWLTWGSFFRQSPALSLSTIPIHPVQSLRMSFQVQSVTIGGPELFLIAGPCVIESEEHALKMAAAIAAVARQLGIPYIFKASYDKANRTSLGSFRGPGLKQGLAILRKVAECVKVPVLTDVHEPGHVNAAAEAVDVLQIPAFLCRQTDLLVAAARSGRAVNIKKGQFVGARGRCATPSPRCARRATTASFSPSAEHRLAITIWWSTCARCPSCASLRPWFSTPHTLYSFLRQDVAI